MERGGGKWKGEEGNVYTQKQVGVVHIVKAKIKTKLQQSTQEITCGAEVWSPRGVVTKGWGH